MKVYVLSLSHQASGDPVACGAYSTLYLAMMAAWKIHAVEARSGASLAETSVRPLIIPDVLDWEAQEDEKGNREWCAELAERDVWITEYEVDA